MGDGFSIWVYCPHSIDYILYKSGLNFNTKVYDDTGELMINSKTAYGERLTFFLKEKDNKKYIIIQGNFYTFLKDECNIGDFSFCDLYHSIKKLVEMFHINPFTTEVKKFELGVNIPYSKPKEYLRSFICMQGLKPSVEYKGHLIRFERDDYELKFYEKGGHCKSDEEIVRHEIRTMKFRYLKKFGIQNLIDLLTIQNLNSLKDEFLALSKKIILFDYSLDLSKLTKLQRETIYQYKDAAEWKKLLENSESNHRKKRVRYNEILSKFLDRNLNAELIARINNKSKILLSETKALQKIRRKSIKKWSRYFTDIQHSCISGKAGQLRRVLGRFKRKQKKDSFYM